MVASKAAQPEERRFLSADEILAATDLQTEEVAVPEWGGFVRVRGLTGTARDRYEVQLATGGPELEKKSKGKQPAMSDRLDNVRALLVAHTVVDGAGALLFNEGQVRALGLKSAVALDRVFQVATRLSGLSDEDVDELAGNS